MQKAILSGVRNRRGGLIAASVLYLASLSAHGEPSSKGSDAGVPMRPIARTNLARAETPAVVAQKRDAYALDAGDRLKIVVYGRDDLQDEYKINDQGMVSIATVGTFEALGRSAAEVERAIRTALEGELQRTAYVTVEVVERRPVFVTGLVAKPGSYAFAQGMRVIHATTLAGGTFGTSIAPWLPSEALREASKLRVARDELTVKLAIAARLASERAGEQQIPIPAALVELVGNDRAHELIASQQVVYERERQAHERKRTTLELAVKQINAEIAAFESELANLTEARRLREVAVESARTLSKKGLTTQQRLTDNQILLASADRDVQVVIANLARAQQGLERAKRDLELLPLERSIELEKQMQTNDEQINKVRAAIDGSEKVIAHISTLPSHLLLQNREPKFTYEILRKAPDGKLVTMKTDETAELAPGDVVRVIAQTPG